MEQDNREQNVEQETTQPEDNVHKLLTMREDEPKRRGLSPKVKKEIREWVVSLAVALIAVFLIRTFLFTVISVQGPSMQETLQNGDRMIVTIIDLKLNGAQRGDVVICHYPDRTDQFVKRVVGVGGDELMITDGTLYVNGEAQDEPYVTHRPTRDFGPYTVPEGHYFVMGDNRANSNDSRYDDVGPLAEDMLVGIARVVIWPFSSLGMIEG